VQDLGITAGGNRHLRFQAAAKGNGVSILINISQLELCSAVEVVKAYAWQLSYVKYSSRDIAAGSKQALHGCLALPLSPARYRHYYLAIAVASSIALGSILLTALIQTSRGHRLFRSLYQPLTVVDKYILSE
jgi:hypothetical protein